MAAKMAMMAMTTSSSMRVNARRVAPRVLAAETRSDKFVFIFFTGIVINLGPDPGFCHVA